MVCESPASASKPKGASRIKNFKNHGRNLEDLRRRQLEMNVELRKVKKEDQLTKRRNLSTEHIAKIDDGLNVEDIVRGIESGDEAKEISSTHAAATLLNKADDPPIEAFVKVIPKLVDFLGRSTSMELQFHSAWALANIVCGTSEQTKAVLHAGGAQKLACLLDSNHLPTAEQVVLALGSMAGDCHEIRDCLIDLEIVEHLVKLARANSQGKILKHLMWAIGNFANCKNVPPKIEVAKAIALALSETMQQTNDTEVLGEVCRALTHLADGPIEYIQPIVDAGVIPHLVRLLGHENESVVLRSLRSIGNILSGSEAQTESVLAAGVCPILSKLLKSEVKTIVKDAAWAVSNIAAGDATQIQVLFECNITQVLIDLLSKPEMKCQKQAAWSLSNIATSGNDEQVKMLLNMGAHVSMSYLLKSEDERTVMAGLDSLETFLIASQKLGELENVALRLEESGILNQVDSLQSHNRELIYRKACTVFEQCFNLPDDEVSELAPSTSIGGNYEFNRPAEAPTGGFSL